MLNLLTNSSSNSPKAVYAQTDINCLQKTLGDANCDGKVDARDYDIWSKQYDKMVYPFPIDNNANFMCVPQNSTTYFVDLTDYEIWRRNTVSGLGADITITPTVTENISLTPTIELTPTNTPVPPTAGPTTPPPPPPRQSCSSDSDCASGYCCASGGHCWPNNSAECNQ